nr:hypothetical protein [Tanacetum cinerariifolium]
MQDDFLNQIRNFMQNLHDAPSGEDKEHEATTDIELSSTEDIQPLPVQEPPQNSDIFLDPAIASVEENVDHQEHEEINLEEISQVQDVVLQRLINLMKNDIPDNSSNDPLLEEVDLFLSDDSIPLGIENVADDPEGDIRF